MTPVGGQQTSIITVLTNLDYLPQIMSRVLIIGNTNQKYLPKWHELIQSADTIIACDGAIADCYESQISVDFLIGDLDSITKQDLARAEQDKLQIIKVDEQQSNDLSKALRFCQNLSVNKIDIIGVDGGKSDHQMANYFALLEHDLPVTLHLNDAIVIAVSKSNPLHYKSNPGVSFSLFSIGETAKVTIKGAKWELNNHDMSPSTMGLHNITAEEFLSINCENGSLLVFIDR
jgi:thiamine pyrophosphokinase